MAVNPGKTCKADDEREDLRDLIDLPLALIDVGEIRCTFSRDSPGIFQSFQYHKVTQSTACWIEYYDVIPNGYIGSSLVIVNQ